MRRRQIKIFAKQSPVKNAGGCFFTKYNFAQTIPIKMNKLCTNKELIFYTLNTIIINGIDTEQNLLAAAAPIKVISHKA